MGGRGSESYGKMRQRAGVRGTGKSRKLRPIDLDEYQGQSLQEIENGIRGLARERLVALDSDGKVIRAYQGTNDSVAFDRNLLFVKGATVTHNHPIGSEGYGGTFSLKDVLNMAASDWAEHRAVASGQGEMNYIIRRTAKTTKQDSRELYERIQQDSQALRTEMAEAARKAKSRDAKSRRQIYVGILDRYYARILPRYNFEYIARKEPYTYNR